MGTLRIKSKKMELITKSREACLAAVQIFNNPNITFKSESFVVLMIIAWTYLMHAYFRDKGIEYRYFDQKKVRKKYHRTKRGAYKYWELERCLNEKKAPLDNNTKNNLKFMIELRHEIEHQMTKRIDDTLSARFQACCLNYNIYLKKLFGKDHGIDRYLSFSLQFSSIEEEQIDLLANSDLPKNIKSFIQDFDSGLSDDEFTSQRFAYRVIFVEKLANHRGQAYKVVEFVKHDSPLAKTLNTEYAVIKETERPKYRPMQIVELMHKNGFPKFKINHHTDFWKLVDAKNPSKGYGVLVSGQWYWYESWLNVVNEHCQEYKGSYK